MATPELFEGMTLDCGIWQSPYIRVFSVGGASRIVEISNYPRAYIDTDPHFATVDTPFTVEYQHLNHQDDNGDLVYQDLYRNNYRLGETGILRAGDRLFGAFPKWLESDTLTGDTNSASHYRFRIKELPRPLKNIGRVWLYRNGNWQDITNKVKKLVQDQKDNDWLEVAKNVVNQNKIILRLYYERIFDWQTSR